MMMPHYNSVANIPQHPAVQCFWMSRSSLSVSNGRAMAQEKKGWAANKTVAPAWMLKDGDCARNPQELMFGSRWM